jgi:osmotically-inducible protein OsmY
MRHFKPITLAAILAAAPGGQLALAEAQLPDAAKRMPGSDLWIESRLITAYSLNEHLNPFDIQVDSENGQVTIKGAVPSESQRRLALQLARDLGAVRTVTDQLEVKPDQAASDDSELYQLVEDANITTRVQLQLLWNSQTGGLDIEVNSNNGRVTLRGTASNAAERRKAEEIALHTQGVRGVDNEIEIDGKASPSDKPADLLSQAAGQVKDTWITTRVAASLRFDNAIKDGRIDVSTNDGVVSLTGEVRSSEQRKQAAAVARGIYGVNRVENKLEIAGSA